LFLVFANKILTDSKDTHYTQRRVHLEITSFETVTRTISASNNETL